MNRLNQLIEEYKEEHGLLPAKRKAKKTRINELLDKLNNTWMTPDEKIVAIQLILTIMNMDD